MGPLKGAFLQAKVALHRSAQSIKNSFFAQNFSDHELKFSLISE